MEVSSAETINSILGSYKQTEKLCEFCLITLVSSIPYICSCPSKERSENITGMKVHIIRDHLIEQHCRTKEA